MNIISRLKIKFSNPPVISSNKLLVTEPPFGNTVTVRNDRIKDSVISLVAVEDDFVGPFQEKFMKIKFSKNPPDNFEFSVLSAQSSLLECGCNVPDKFSFDRKLVKIQNGSNNVIFIQKGTFLAYFRDPTFVERCCTESDRELFVNYLVTFKDLNEKDKNVHLSELDKWKKRRAFLVKSVSLKPDIDFAVSTVKENFRKPLLELLLKYDAVFGRTKSDIS